MNPIDNSLNKNPQLTDSVNFKNQKKDIREQDNKIQKEGKKFLESIENQEFKVDKSNNINFRENIDFENLNAKSVGLYSCVKREKDPLSEGYFYHFEIKKELQNLSDNELINIWKESNDNLFPAILQKIKFTRYDTVFSVKNDQMYEFYKMLGYDNTSEYSFIFPDATTLTHRWQELQKQDNYSHLPDLNIISSEGTADDKTYIEYVKKGYIPLSTGSEFLHDHTTHVLSRIELINFNKDIIPYDALMKRFEKEVDTVIQSINLIEENVNDPTLTLEKRSEWKNLCDLAWTALGLIVDVGSSMSSRAELKEFLRNPSVWRAVFSPSLHNKIVNYLSQRYKEDYEKNKIHFQNLLVRIFPNNSIYSTYYSL